MPDSSDIERYRQRAEEWQNRAASLPDGDNRNNCLTIADGYAKLVRFLETERQRLLPREDETSAGNEPTES